MALAKEKRDAMKTRVIALLQKHPDRNQRWIAKQAGVSQGFVSKVYQTLKAKT